MEKKRTIGMNPLDLMVAPTKAVPKQKLTVYLIPSVVERVRNAVYWTPGETLASFTEEALSKALQVVEAERGGPFPSRKSELKAGRPPK